MSKPKKAPSPDIVVPTIVATGEKEHALKALFREDNAPVLKSVGYSLVPGLTGQGRFVSYVITSQGDQVLNIEVEQPNLKAIAEESAKMAFVNTLMRDDEW